MPHNVTALSACQKMYCVDVGEGVNVGRLRAFILRPVGHFRHFKDEYMNLAGEDPSTKYKGLIWLPGAAWAESQDEDPDKPCRHLLRLCALVAAPEPRLAGPPTPSRQHMLARTGERLFSGSLVLDVQSREKLDVLRAGRCRGSSAQMRIVQDRR